MRSKFAKLVALSFLTSTAGCSILVDFDESKIPADDTGVDASNGEVATDSGLDAGNDATNDADAIAETSSDAGSDANDSASDATTDAGEDASEAATDAGEDAGDSGNETATEDAADSANETAIDDAADSASEATTDAGDDANEVASDGGDDGDVAVEVGSDASGDATDATTDTGPSCSAPSDCPGSDTECATRSCNGGVCGTNNLPVTTVLSQTAGDCQKRTCDGNGNVVSGADDSDTPSETTACKVGTCSSGVPGARFADPETPCTDSGGSVCDGGGFCVACVSNGDCTSNVCSGNTCQTASLVLLAGGSSGSIGGEFHPGGAWTTSPLATNTDGVAIALTSATAGVGVAHATADDALDYTVWSFGSGFTAFANVASGVTTRAIPSISASASRAQVVFQGTDFKEYYAAYAGSWSPTAEAVTNAGNQSAGPTPAAIVANGNDATIAFFNTSNQPNAQQRVSGAWNAPTMLSNDQSFVASPSIVALSGASGDMMIVFIRQSDGAVMYSIHTTTWSAPSVIAGANAQAATSFGPIERVGLAALPGGGAIVAYRRKSDGALELSTYASGAWSSVAAFAPTVMPIAPPALAKGVGTDVAELAFIESDGVAYHSRNTGSAWTTPIAVGGSSLTSVAIASAP